MQSSRQLLFSAALSSIWVLASCVSTNRDNPALRSWLGHNQNELVAAWGQPDRVRSDGHGGKTLTYERVSAYIDAGSVMPDNESRHFIVDGSQASRTTHRQEFRVDRSGRIYSWRRQQ